MKTIIRITVIFILILFAADAVAQSKVATTIGQFLKIEPSSRFVAMGNAGTSLSNEASAAFYNPASLGELEGVDVQFTYNQWLADINYSYATAALNIDGVGTFAVQVTSLNSGDIEIRTVEKEKGTGLYYDVTNLSLGLAYAILLTDRVSAGLAVNYIQETIYNTSLNDVSLNFGVQYQTAIEGLRLGASVSNFGPRASYDGRDIYFNYDADPNVHGDNSKLPSSLRMGSYSLPTLFRVGISYSMTFAEWNQFIFSTDAMHSNDNNERINIGGEWEFLGSFAVRGGYRDLLLKDSEGGLVLGAGAKVGFSGSSKVSFDYAWADYGRLNATHRFTVGLHF
ncbi:MAG TPA: PorV/PorQ family protein [Ignavibacteriaceae bacterium]|nr:PorV/PorQ family protein [Ignavibacteriaceae bacterium]